MKATEAKLLDLLKKSPQFVIPIYQRTYSWTEKECRQFWDDVIRVGNDDSISAHFVGSIVYIEKGLYQVTSQAPLLVIDGQQRLTTITLLLEAVARQLEHSEPVDGFSAKKIRNYYLLNALEDGERAFKLLLTQTDRDSLLALVQQREMPNYPSIRIKENFEFFERMLKTTGVDVATLCKGLTKLVVVDISLNRDQDNPQLIFESMNSTGKELSQADLIRNFILMGLEPKHQTKLYEKHWRPMELAFGQEKYGTYFDSFMRDFLTMRTGTIPNMSGVYERFKEHTRSSKVRNGSVDELVADIHDCAKRYCAMAFGTDDSKILESAFQSFRELKVDVAYPLLLEMYADYQAKILSEVDFATAVHLIESYVFRRTVCAIPTNSLNLTFATLGRTLKKDRYLESLQAALMLLPSYRRFPTDEEFTNELKVRDLYSFSRRSYWLRRLENYGSKEKVAVDEYTIEHIMPQNPNLSLEWRETLGNEWEHIQKKWLHTLGNLTLTGYNSEYSDRPFQQKRDMKGGFRESPIKLNRGLGSLEVWNEEQIIKRAERLSKLACEVWLAPSLDAEVLAVYRPKGLFPASYSIDDHPNLSEHSPMRALFEAFRNEVKALDPCVNEEFLKIYVAYKAETNFVDLVPYKSMLRIYINLPFHDIVDPKGLCKDVTNLGTWGNGDIQVTFSSITELPYVMGLVRQALERQLESGGGRV